MVANEWLDHRGVLAFNQMNLTEVMSIEKHPYTQKIVSYRFFEVSVLSGLYCNTLNGYSIGVCSDIKRLLPQKLKEKKIQIITVESGWQSLMKGFKYNDLT